MFRTLFALILSILISNAAGAQQTLGAEALIGHLITPEGVQVQVHSGGCTSKRNFKVVREVQSDDRQVITFVRTQIDPCLGFFTYGRVLNYSYEELGIQIEDRIEIGNPHSGVTVY